MGEHGKAAIVPLVAKLCLIGKKEVLEHVPVPAHEILIGLKQLQRQEAGGKREDVRLARLVRKTEYRAGGERRYRKRWPECTSYKRHTVWTTTTTTTGQYRHTTT